MPTKVFTSGRIRKAEYDAASRQLDLHWDNKSVLAYKQVPHEVYLRLCSAPNPATYWEDRIADEYPKGTPTKRATSGHQPKTLADLFGGASDRDVSDGSHASDDGNACGGGGGGSGGDGGSGAD